MEELKIKHHSSRIAALEQLLEVFEKSAISQTENLEQAIQEMRAAKVSAELAQIELQKSHEYLEQNVRERTQALLAANEELESFSYSVSHDLRTPLRGIDGFSQALLEDYAPALDATGQKYLNYIRESTQKMGKLIDDLLNLSRLGRAPLEKNTVNLSDIATSVLREIHERDPQRSVETIIAPDLEASADHNLLKIVLENLLGNAWKFTAKQPNARIEFGIDHSDNKVIFYVRDNGAGFDMAHSNKLFRAFQRLHTAQEFEGTGVGLATVRRIIHRHGGTLWATGEPNRGATFFFTLPTTNVEL